MNEKITVEQARLRAMDKRMGLFTSGVNVLLQRVKPEEVELLAIQKRWEPFWNVVCTSAGDGKTTLVTEWCTTRQPNGAQIHPSVS